MKLVVKVYREEDGRAVVGYVDETYPDWEMLDLIFDAWRITHGEVLRLDMARVEAEKVKALNTGEKDAADG